MSERLLKLVGPAHVAGGLLLFASGFSPTAMSLLESSLAASPALDWSPFFVAVLGPTIASWGLLFGALVNQFLTAPSTPGWRVLLLSLLLWAPLDTSLCLAYGFYGGVALNLIVFTAVVGLLFAVKARKKL